MKDELSADTSGWPTSFRLIDQLSDADLQADLASAHIEGRCDFGGFEVLKGTDRRGNEYIWIRNGLRDSPHVRLTVPPAALHWLRQLDD